MINRRTHTLFLSPGDRWLSGMPDMATSSMLSCGHLFREDSHQKECSAAVSSEKVKRGEQIGRL